jgi:hypothetical protein
VAQYRPWTDVTWCERRAIPARGDGATFQPGIAAKRKTPLDETISAVGGLKLIRHRRSACWRMPLPIYITTVSNLLADALAAAGKAGGRLVRGTTTWSSCPRSGR